MSDDEIDTDWYGEALDLFVDESRQVVAMRRLGPVINLGINKTVVALNAEQADLVGRSLLAAAKLARDGAS